MKKLCTSIALAFALASLAGPVSAEPGRQQVKVEFRYDAGKSAAANYTAFLRRANRACTNPSPKPLALAVHEKACAADLMDKLVDRMGRADLASVHFGRTGRRSGDTLAAR